MPRYRVHHRTTYAYGQPVSLARHLLHLLPRQRPGQRLLAAHIAVDPVPSWLSAGLDAYGNPRTALSIETAHRQLCIDALSEVEVEVSALPPLAPATVAALRAANGYRGGAPVEGAPFLFASPYVQVSGELDALCGRLLPAEAPVLEAVDALSAAIHAEFRYAPGATAIGTAVSEVMRQRAGVCQDFAHLAIACLRRAGIPARYVSGYLLTDPPAGQPRLLGADASHAWFAVCLPDAEGRACWVDFDPTNGCRADARYVTLGWGRDFGDVSPVRGVILGGGEHVLRVEVTVSPLDEAHAAGRAADR